MKIYSNKKIRNEFTTYLQDEISQLTQELVLVVYLLSDDPSSRKYVGMKQKMADSFGISVLVRTFVEKDYPTIQAQLIKDGDNSRIHGIIIQLPIIEELNDLVYLIPPHKDVDLLNPQSTLHDLQILQPTVQAINICLNDFIAPDTSILQKIQNVDYYSTHTVCVVGQGRLVGNPFTEFIGSLPSSELLIIDKDTPEPTTVSQNADLIVTGAGVPGLINPQWLNRSTIVIDASTSDDNGQLVGDVDRTAEYLETQSLIPSPGGIGPITVLSLFYNLMVLNKLGT